MEEMGEVKYDGGTMIPWAFSQIIFGEFVDQLERAQNWKYSGNSELILLGPAVDVSNILVLDIDVMVRDGCIGNSAELFEAMIRFCRNAVGNPSAYDFSDQKGAKELGSGAVESLLANIPTPERGLWKGGRHYAVRNIAT
jgi:hypothetical protein